MPPSDAAALVDRRADEETADLNEDAAARERAERFGHLPAPVALEDTVESQDTEPPGDPTMGRDPERDFMLRNAGG